MEQDEQQQQQQNWINSKNGISILFEIKIETYIDMKISCRTCISRIIA